MDSRAVHDQVERILRSGTFTAKNQLKKLLEILSENVDSQSNLTPALVIRALWPDEVRTKRSADVATEMNRLRHALEAYYSAEGANDPITIYLPNRAANDGDGAQERRWIAAKLRNGHEPATADTTVRPAASSGRFHEPAMAGGVKPAVRSSRFRRIGIGVGALAVLGLTAFLLRASLAHPQPQFGRVDGPVLRIMDGKGKELWSKTFPEGIGPEWYYAANMGPRLWFVDLEGKGDTSVLFNYSSAAPHSATLICYSSGGREKWRWTPGRELPELSDSPATYEIDAVEVLREKEQGPARIVVASAHAIWWPSQIAMLDANGKLISEYWHSGALTDLALADLDGNGRQEIIAAGVDNGYDHQATLVVLDPDRLSGASSEANPSFQLHGMGTAQERLRLLFPRSDLNRALYQYNKATELSFARGHVRVSVMECIAPLACRIWYEFEKDFRLIAAFAGGDEFRSAHNRFYQTGPGAHTLTDQEQAAFQKVRCLAGCKTEYLPVGELVP